VMKNIEDDSESAGFEEIIRKLGGGLGLGRQKLSGKDLEVVQDSKGGHALGGRVEKLGQLFLGVLEVARDDLFAPGTQLWAGVGRRERLSARVVGNGV